MTRASKRLTFFLVAALGIWGCARVPQPNVPRVRFLETRCAKLEAETRREKEARQAQEKMTEALQFELEKVRQELESVNKHQAYFRQELESSGQIQLTLRQELFQQGLDQDTLRREVARAHQAQVQLQEELTRTQQIVASHQPLLRERLTLLTQRDEARMQIDTLRKGLQSLLRQTETASANPGSPNLDVVAPTGD